MPLNLNADGELKVDATINVGDIEIGAVEIKNGTDDTRLTVRASTSDATKNGIVVINPDGSNIGASGTTSATTGTISSVAGSTSTGVLLALNTSRKGALFFNDSTAILYLALAATASSTAYSVQIAGGAFYELSPLYTGVISGIWSAANGNARITELS
jgi:type 1 fimbria pilin